MLDSCLLSAYVFFSCVCCVHVLIPLAGRKGSCKFSQIPKLLHVQRAVSSCILVAAERGSAAEDLAGMA